MVKRDLNRKIPFVVKIICIVSILSFWFFLSNGISLVSEGVKSQDQSDWIFIFIGIFFIILGAIILLMSIGLWKLKNWARITAIVIVILLLIFDLFDHLYSLLREGFIMGVVYPILLLLIGYYLGFNKDVRGAFLK